MSVVQRVGRALVVDVERSAPAFQRAVVDDRAQLRGDALADAARERRRALAVEVPFQAVPDRLVQQHAGPARAEHDGHRAGGRRHGLEVHERLAHCLARVRNCAFECDRIQAEAAATAAEALLAPPVLLGDDRNVDAHQRPHVAGERAIARHHQDYFVQRADRGHHLGDARVHAARLGIEPLQQAHLVRIGHGGERIDRKVQPVPGARLPRLHRMLAALARDRAGGARGFLQRGQHDLVRVGETRLLATHGAHAHALLDAVAAVLDDAVLDRPGLLARELEIQVRGVDLVTHHRAEHARQARFVQARGREQRLTRECEGIGGCFSVHCDLQS